MVTGAMVKRILIDEPTSADLLWPSKRRKKRVSQEVIDSAVARLLTTAEDGRVHSILVAVDRPAIIGRSPTCHYVVQSPVVSSKHCKVFAVQNDSGITICCQDLSTHGVAWNGHKIQPKTTLLLMHNDILTLPSGQHFRVVYTVYSKAGAHSREVATIDKRYIITSTELGKGSQAVVRLAFDTLSGQQVACKTFTSPSDHQKERVLKEVDFLRRLDHPNINLVLSACEIPVTDHNCPTPDTGCKDSACGPQIHVFLDLSTGGDLFSHMVRRCMMNEMESKYFLYQLLLALGYLHTQGIAHRDLKPENVLLHTPPPYPRLIIADFGIARELPAAKRHTMTVVGTLEYLAPEYAGSIKAGKVNIDGPKAGMAGDCWAVGCIGYQMLTGHHPFYAEYIATQDTSQSQASGAPPKSEEKPLWATKKSQVLTKRILDQPVPFDDPVWEKLPHAEEMIRGLLHKDAVARWTAPKALACKWITVSRQAMDAAYHKTFTTAEPR